VVGIVVDCGEWIGRWIREWNGKDWE